MGNMIFTNCIEFKLDISLRRNYFLHQEFHQNQTEAVLKESVIFSKNCEIQENLITLERRVNVQTRLFVLHYFLTVFVTIL